MSEEFYSFFVEYKIYFLLVNILLFISANKIFSMSGETNKFNLFVFKLINITFIVLTALGTMFKDSSENLFYLSMSLLFLYFSILLQEGSGWYILRKLGTKTGSDGKSNYVENHNSRIMTIISMVMISIISLIVLIKIWGFDSALETTGIFGIIFGFLAFTSSTWAPDLFSGILLLNNNLINNGDLIVIKGKKYIVFKFGFFETILLKIESNERVFFKNSEMRNNSINILNKLSSPTGLREEIVYKLPYQNKESYEIYFETIEKVAKRIQEDFYNLSSKINENKDIEVNIKEAGDFAIHVSFSYYLSGMNEIKSTSTARELFALKYKFNKLALIQLQRESIYLNTPIQIEKIEGS